jgi:hypothetical protein
MTIFQRQNEGTMLNFRAKSNGNAATDEDRAIIGEGCAQRIIAERDALRQRASSLERDLNVALGNNKLMRGLISRLLTDRSHHEGALGAAFAHLGHIKHAFFAMEQSVATAHRGDELAARAQAEILDTKAVEDIARRLTAPAPAPQTAEPAAA